MMDYFRKILILIVASLVAACDKNEEDVHAIVGVSNMHSGGEYSRDEIYKAMYVTSNGNIHYRFDDSDSAVNDNLRAWYSESMNQIDVDFLVDNSKVVSSIERKQVDKIKGTISKLSKHDLNYESVCYHYPPTIQYFALQFDETTGKYKTYLLKQAGSAIVNRDDINYDQLIETINNIVESSNLDLDLCKEDSECC